MLPLRAVICTHTHEVDTKKVATAEEAAKAILGDQGTPLHLQMQREWEGKTIKFPVKLVRDKPK